MSFSPLSGYGYGYNPMMGVGVNPYMMGQNLNNTLLQSDALINKSYLNNKAHISSYAAHHRSAVPEKVAAMILGGLSIATVAIATKSLKGTKAFFKRGANKVVNSAEKETAKATSKAADKTKEAVVRVTKENVSKSNFTKSEIKARAKAINKIRKERIAQEAVAAKNSTQETAKKGFKAKIKDIWGNLTASNDSALKSNFTKSEIKARAKAINKVRKERIAQEAVAGNNPNVSKEAGDVVQNPKQEKTKKGVISKIKNIWCNLFKKNEKVLSENPQVSPEVKPIVAPLSKEQQEIINKQISMENELNNSLDKLYTEAQFTNKSRTSGTSKRPNYKKDFIEYGMQSRRRNDLKAALNKAEDEILMAQEKEKEFVRKLREAAEKLGVRQD